VAAQGLIREVDTLRTKIVLSASPETLYPNKKQQVARSYGDKEF